ncbi:MULTISPECIES: energy transducer TonB [unclassified Janthinobacterium]|uniref:energy transducer TonB n=1 Tax=unclassified Janthinobacterium TaxID=2610881 RepID=UPI00034D4CFF|nr:MULTISPECIES: energy transducer TonB [unclassified Janthinobacterium]MEC5162446.1 protein TonB [Janthinobacterium sp. CG_S6]
MNTMTMTPRADSGRYQDLLATLKLKGRKFAPLASIIVLHVGLFYALQNGMLRQVVHAALPEVMMVSFVAPPPPPKPAPPAPPKTLQLSAPQQRAIVPPLPQLALAPAEPTITVAQPPAEVAPAPAAPVAVAAPPAPAPAPATPRTVSSVEYVRAPEPVYPSISRRLGESGTVVLRILINERGLAEQVTVQKSSGFANLDEAGRKAALRALFKPLFENGKAVPVFVIVPLNFQLS